MKKVCYFLFVYAFFISCSSDTEPEQEIPSILEGKQAFRIEVNEISAKTASAGSRKNTEPAFALLSINNSNGNAVLTREKTGLTKVGDSYVTAEITLDKGTYTLVEFIAVDENDIVTSLAPKENSVLAQFAMNPLPIDFEVSPDETKVSATENINAAGYASVDFGYEELDLELSESSDFFSLTVDDSSLLTPKTLILKSITGSVYTLDWGDGTTEEYVSTIINSGIENDISHTYSENGIYTINVSGPVEAIELLDFGSADQDNGYQSNLTSADLEKLTLLKSCQLYAGKLTTLNTSANLALEFLSLGYNQISGLDLSNNPNLKSMWLRYNNLAAIDVSQNPNLEFLWVEGNDISELDLSNNPGLKVLLARENNLSSVDFSKNLDLERFDLANNLIPAIDISINTALTEINAGANMLTEIDLSNNTKLLRIDLYNNQIGSIDLTSNMQLRDLYIDNNQLSDINLSSNPDLERLIIENNNLSTLDISANPKIFDLEVGGNQLTGPQLDQIISGVHEQAVSNSVMNGYIDYKNNPGSSDIADSTLIKINELLATYNWTFNNN